MNALRAPRSRIVKLCTLDVLASGFLALLPFLAGWPALASRPLPARPTGFIEHLAPVQTLAFFLAATRRTVADLPF